MAPGEVAFIGLSRAVSSLVILFRAGVDTPLLFLNTLKRLFTFVKQVTFDFTNYTHVNKLDLHLK